MGSGLSKIRHSKPHEKSCGNTSQANTGVVHNRRNQEPAAPEAQFSGPQPVPHTPYTILGKPYDDVRLHYTFGRELGRDQFACKSIAKRKLVSKTDRDDIKREVHIMRRLSGQPNIVVFKGAYEDRHSVHIVMELCAGGELFDRIIAKGHYSERAAASAFRDIMNIVNVCHSKGVVHRDLKP